MIGTSIGRYHIQSELGHGGMSVVYKGYDEDLERDIAVKVLHAHLAKKKENRMRLHREAKAIARLRHENILEIYDYARQDAESSYIVMEYVEGENLREFMAHWPPPSPEHCALIGITLCRALSHAHQTGIIHRDLKPENVMVSSAGVLKLMDFGIAHVFDAETMTQTGSLLGSPGHMAPEMIEGEKVDVRADIFALGTVLYWLATGELPFEGKNAPQILKRVLEGLYKNPEAVNPKVGQSFADIIRGCMAYELEDRYANTQEVIEALSDFLKHSPLSNDHDQELKRYFLDPAGVSASFEAALLPILQERACVAMEEGEHQRAFALFNRILAYEPENAMVRAQLARMQKRPLPKRTLLAASVLVLAMGAGTWAMMHAPEPKPIITPIDSQQSALRAEATRDAESWARALATSLRGRAQELAEPLARSREAGSRQAALTRTLARNIASTLAQRSARAPTITRITPPQLVRGIRSREDMGSTPPDMKVAVAPVLATYKFRVFPFSATLFIDGTPHEAHNALLKGVELERGRKYRVRVDCEACIEQSFNFETDRAPEADPRNISLEWKDGIIKIKANKRVHLYLDRSPNIYRTLEAGQTMSYPVKFGRAKTSRLPSKRVHFQARDTSDLMSPPYQINADIRPGDTQTFTAKL